MEFRIAYLITAYKDPAHLNRLILALNEDADFYVHIDSKVDILPFLNATKNISNVFFSKQRYFVNWGSFAQVLCQKELINLAFSSENKYKRFVCISGTDYPLWSNARIRKEFMDNCDKEYIMGQNFTANDIQNNRYNCYHFFRDIKIRNYNLKKIFSGSARIFMQYLPVRKGIKVSLGGGLVDVFFGSDYWALTTECARYVLDIMENEKKFMKYFKYSFVPSELCVQTIVFNSKFRSKAIEFKSFIYKGLVSVTPLHYIEYANSIKIFQLQDFDTIVDQNKMFFRKAEMGISDTLVSKVNLLRE